MDAYVNPNEQDDLKKMLYSYLKDKAQRRTGITSKAQYEGAEDQFAKQMGLRDAGSLLGSLSEAGSMAGQIQGKRAESDIVPRINQELYGTTQGAYENFRTLRDQEERSNMNDLNIARYLTDMERASDANKLATRDRDLREQQYKDLGPRRQLELELLKKKAEREGMDRRKLEDSLVGPGGEPVTMDDYGRPQTMPGYKLREKPIAGGSLSVVPGYEAPGKILMRDAQGNLVSKDLPTGFEPKKTGAQGAQKGDVEALYRSNILQSNAQKLKDIIDRVGTFELTGPESTQMDSLIYQMAVDYAKMVDPESVAREGEVASAQKYMLPVRNLGGLAVKNETAKKIIDDYVKSLDDRMQARTQAKAGMAQPKLAPNEVIRRTKDGKKAVFDSNTRQFIRMAE